MNNLIKMVTDLKVDEGINETLIPEFKIIRTNKVFDPVQAVYKPSLCLILQGSKDVIVGDKIYPYRPGEYIFCSVEVPVTGRITKASAKEPYFCLMIEVEPSMVYEVLKYNPQLKSNSPSEKSGTFVNKATPSLYDAFTRLLATLKDPADSKFLSPMIMKEIIFRILNDDNGEVVRQMGIAGSQTQRITSAIGIIKKKYSTTLNIEELAGLVGMSPSSFHKYFKDITNMSPLQYQKLIRLQEARRLLLSDSIDAASVGFKVGYESPSQFSREYSRLFGKPPKQDMKALKAN